VARVYVPGSGFKGEGALVTLANRCALAAFAGGEVTLNALGSAGDISLDGLAVPIERTGSAELAAIQLSRDIA